MKKNKLAVRAAVSAAAVIAALAAAAVRNQAGTLWYLIDAANTVSFTLRLDKERDIAMKVKAALPATVTGVTTALYNPENGAPLEAAGPDGFYYAPKSVSSVRVDLLVPAGTQAMSCPVTVELGAGDWNRPFDPRTVTLIAARNPLKGAVDAAAETPDVITVFSDIPMTSSGNITIPSGKHIRLVSGGGRRVLKRALGNGAYPLFTVNGELTLENIIIDGGAVWGAKLTLGAGAVLQNNYNGGGSIPANLGDGIRAMDGAQVVVNGAGAAVRYNFAGWTGGGIALFDSSVRGTKLTLINGSIDNNKANYGGGITTKYCSIDMRGGTVTKNYAPSAGGGINFSNCNNGLTASISGGSISENRAEFGGGIRIEYSWAITMSGSAVISGNTAGPSGGGVLSRGTFTMSGNALISGNTAATNGSGVYLANGTFKMAGGAVVRANNEVLLANGKTINITDDLTGTAPVATITPET